MTNAEERLSRRKGSIDSGVAEQAPPPLRMTQLVRVLEREREQRKLRELERGYQIGDVPEAAVRG
jgi:hypothetical protein